MNGLLKILTCGSVDDGKSTLIGHLLYDAKLLFADQEDALALESKATGKEGELDYSLLLDGLIAEREQGITIDVAYRYFQTARRSFIVADSPGHEEYTRNMAVGASFADLAVLLVDASRGIRTQTRRHLRICRLMGIRHFVFAVNKMDLVDYREDAFRAIESELLSLPGARESENLSVIPVSATAGDNITSPSNQMPWYGGPTLLSYLEEIPVEAPEEEGFILPIQRVCRPDATYRGYEGTISCGSIAAGATITVLPQQLESRVTGLLRAGEEAEEAAAGDAVSLSLADEIDISRGSVLASGTTIRPADKFQAMLLWMDEEPLTEGKRYTLKLATQTKTASVMRIKYIEDIDTAGKLAGRTLEKNGLACVDIACAGELLCDAFDRHRELGRFLLIDKVTHRTAACGTILFSLRRAHNLSYQDFSMTRTLRSEALGQKPMTLWFTGLSGSGKSTLANAMEQRLTSEGFHTMILDGDNVRLGLNRDLGFEKRDRIENIRRVAEVAKLMNDAGLVVLVSFISPFAEDRRRAKEIIGDDYFLEVYVSTPLAECERRDIKGLYKKARAGEIPNFTGINSPYEAPESPEAEIDTTGRAIGDCAEELMNTLRRNWER